MTLHNTSWLSLPLTLIVRLQVQAQAETLLKAYYNPFETAFDGEAALNTLAVLLEQAGTEMPLETLTETLLGTQGEEEKETEKTTTVTLLGKVETETRALEQGSFAGALACLYASQGQFKAVERWLQLAEQQAPTQGYTLWAKALWANHLGLNLLAEQAYQQAFTVLPAWAQLASGLQWQQLAEQNKSVLSKEALKVEPQNAPPQKKALLKLAVQLYGQPVLKRTWPLLKQLWQSKPWETPHADKTTQTELSLQLYSLLFTLTPGWAECGLKVIEQLLAQNKLNTALIWAQRLLHRHPAHLGVLWSLLDTYKRQGRPLEALHVAEKLYELAPNSPAVCLSLGNLYEATEQSHRAMEPYLQVLVHGQTNALTAAAAMRLGHLAMQQGAPKEWTFSCFTMAAMADESLRSEARHLMGLLAFEQGWMETAQAVSYQALAEEKETRQAALHWSHIGYLNSLRQHWGNAVGAYEQALKLDKHMDVALNNLGVIYMDCLGQAEQAKPLLERAVVANPAYATAFYNLGRYLNQHNQPSKAEACFHRAQWLQSHPGEKLDEEALSFNIAVGSLDDSFSGAFPWQWLFNGEEAETPTPPKGEASGF